jgi:hypothetical protein
VVLADLEQKIRSVADWAATPIVSALICRQEAAVREKSEAVSIPETPSHEL